MRRLLVSAALLTACAQAKEEPSAGSAAEAPTTIVQVGIYPDKWECKSLTTEAQLTAILGGTIQTIDTPIIPERGVPRPCNYLRTDPGAPPKVPPTQEAWTYDIDCRDDMIKRANALFDQYAKDSASMVEQYNALTDAGALPVLDGGAPNTAPGAAVVVEVGAKALDHHGQGLLFIDDDAPCYVRVVGPDAARRLALAKHLAQALTPATAPMTPRRAN